MVKNGTGILESIPDMRSPYYIQKIMKIGLFTRGKIPRKQSLGV